MTRIAVVGVNAVVRLPRAAGLWLERLRPLWVGAVMPAFVLFEGRYLVYGLILATFLWLWAGWGSGVWLRRTPLDGLWLLWLVMIPVTLWATAVPDLTRAALSAFLAQCLAFWTLVTWVRTTVRARWAGGGLILLAVVLAGLAPFWLQWGNRVFPIPEAIRVLPERVPLPIQEVVNKNVMAGILVGLWPLSLAWLGVARGRWRWPERLAALLSAGAILGVLVLSQSRGAWVAAAGSLFVLVVLRWRVMWVGAPLGILGAAVLAWQGRLLPLVAQALQSDALGGIEGRFEVWSRALYAVQDFVFTGIGMGTFSRVIPLLYPYFLQSPDAEVPHAHNLFLQVAVDLGMPGLIAFLGMVLGTGVLVAQALRLLTREGESEMAWLLRGAAAGLGAALIHGLVDAVTWNTRPAFLVWAVWGLAVGIGTVAGEQGLGAR